MTEPLVRTAADSGTVDADSPWPGLASFREADRELFFGRESETEELFRLVLRERLTVLFGLSGLGKTSLLQAGVFPRLREDNVLPVSIRLDHSAAAPPFTEQILVTMARACAAAGAEMPEPRPGETLWELFHRQGNDFWNARNRPVVPLLAFDQFEEIFTLGAGNPATADLIVALAALAEGHPPAEVKARLDANPGEAKQFSFGRHPYKLLLSLREDFLPDLEGLRDRIRTIGNNRMRVRRMTGENALRVVLLPGRGLVEPEVAERVVRFVSGEEPGEEPAPLPALEIEPALLSIVCRELNNKRRARGEARITADLLEGSRTEILTGLYERSLDGLGPEIRTFIEERLLTVSGFRDSVALENALATPGISREAIDHLTQRRLLRIEDQGGGQRLELTHDVLTGVARQSRDSRRQREAEQRAEIARREAEERERKMRRELRRSRQMLAVFAILLVGVAALSIYAYRLEQTAKRALAVSGVERAFNLEASRSQEALACLAHALRHDPDNLGARSLLFDVLLDRSWLLPVREISFPNTASLEMASDGRTYAVLTKSGDVLLQNLDTLRQIGPPLHDASPVLSFKYSIDGRRLATSTATATRIWDARTGAPAGGPFPRQDGDASCFDISCSLLSQVVESNTLFLDAATGRPVGPPLPTVTLVSHYSPDGVRALTIQRQKAAATIFIHDLRTGRSVGSPLPHDGFVSFAEFSPDGRLIIAALREDLQVWDAETQGRLALLHHDAPVDNAAMDSDGQVLATHSVDGVTSFWEPRSGRLLSTLRLESDWLSAELSPGGKVLVLVTEDRTVRLWDVYAGRLLGEPVPDVADARPRGINPRQLVTASEDGVVRILAPTGASQSTVVGTPTDVFDAAAFSSDARLVATVEGGTLTVREAASGNRVGPQLTDLGRAFRVRFVDGNRQVAAILADRVLTWDFRAGRIVAQAPVQPGFSYLNDVSPDGKKAVLVASASYPPALQVVDLATGKPLTRPLPHEAQWHEPAPFSLDSRRLLMAPTEISLRVLDAASGKPLATLQPHGGRVLSAVFSPDGRRVLTVADDRTARLWDATSGRLLRSIVSPHGLAGAVFAADSRFVITIAEDTRVRLWDAETGKAQGERLITPSARSAQLAPDGHRMLVLSEDTARLWDITAGRPLGNPTVPGGRIFDARFTPDGHRLFVVSEENLTVSDIPLAEDQDVDLLIRWADAVSGFHIDASGIMTNLPDTVGQLDALRKETAGAPLGKPTTPSLIHWFLSDPAKRPPSPLAP